MRPSGSALPMLRTSHGRPQSPKLRADNLRALSIFAQAIQSPSGLAAASADAPALLLRLERFRVVYRRKHGASPLDDLQLSLVERDGREEVWIAHRTILVPPAEPVPQPEVPSL